MKVNAAKRCFYDGESVKSVSKELGCSTASLYNWRNKYVAVRCMVKTVFHNNRQCCGYRRIHGILKNSGIVISEKVIHRLMKEEVIVVKRKKARKYNSYKGEITRAVPNLVERNFHSNKPNKLLLTDITEFAIPAGKVYLSIPTITTSKL